MRAAVRNTGPILSTASHQEGMEGWSDTVRRSGMERSEWCWSETGASSGVTESDNQLGVVSGHRYAGADWSA
eukprot:5293219-Amphidinium_carterae.1